MASRELCFRILIISFANIRVSLAACLACDGFRWPRLLAATINCLVFWSRIFNWFISRSSLRVLARIKLLHFRIYHRSAPHLRCNVWFSCTDLSCRVRLPENSLDRFHGEICALADEQLGYHCKKFDISGGLGCFIARAK